MAELKHFRDECDQAAVPLPQPRGVKRDPPWRRRTHEFALQRRAQIALHRGQHAEAVALLDEALAIARESDVGFHLFDRIYGTRIIAATEPATSLFFLRSGVVHVKLPGGIRLATIAAGMAFGEMALLESHRSADVEADKSVTALEVPLADFERFREQHPRTGERIMRNLAQLLADRLIAANARVNLLTAD